EHLWNVINRFTYKGKKEEWVTISLEEMMNIGIKNSNGQSKFRIPILNSPVEFIKKDISIDPYTLGCLIGDGTLCAHSLYFTTNDTEILNYFTLPENYDIHKQLGENYNYRLTTQDRKPSLNKYLKELGLYGTKSHNKFIPELYKYNSLEIRLEILRGLLDTDGDIGQHPDGTTRIQFNSTSLRLIEDVIEIVNSLGGITTKPRVDKTHKKGNKSYFKNQVITNNYDCYRINIILPLSLNPFKLKRKADLFKNPTSLYRTIRKIELIGNKEAQCILVDSPSHLYLTDNFIVTHNTLNNSVLILDEFQNATLSQVYTALSRLGKGTKIIVTGDMSQCDLPKKTDSGFDFFKKLETENVPGVKIITLKGNHRHELVDHIAKIYQEYKD
ncbi:MAG TPA: PhoH family protein, partial [Nitrososphaeraceae archaeon]|nr:PhoH family protein [Nitrososphaeraceae archaeon]